MAETMEVRVKLDDQASRLLKKIDDALRSLNGRMGGLQTSSVAAGTGLGKLASKAGVAKIGIAAVGAAAVATTKAIIEGSRAYENTVNQLKLVTEGTEDYNATIQKLSALARDNRTSFDATVELYTKLKVATEELGYSTSDVEQLTTKLSQALAVAGADAGTANGVIRQFGQAMASGVVRGDEFNSIVEGLGPALNIMARESGINVGKLREMAQNGELTADVFAKMLLNSNALSESFEKMPKTIDQVEQQTKDSFTRMLAAIGQATGAVDLYKRSLEGLGNTFESIAASVTPKTGIEKLNEDLAFAMKQLKELEALKTRADAGDITAVLPQPSMFDESAYGAYLNPNATKAEIQSLTDALINGQAPVKTYTQAIDEQKEAIFALKMEIFRLAEAKSRANYQAILDKKASEEAAIAAEEEAKKIALLDSIYSRYATSRTESLQAYQKQQALYASTVDQMIAAEMGHLDQQTRYAILYQDAEDKLKEYNDQLLHNTSLTKTQRAALEQIVAQLKIYKSDLHDAGIQSEIGRKVTNELTTALAENASERRELEALIADMNIKMRAEGGQTEQNAAKLAIYNEMLRDNALARDEILRKPMTLESLTTQVDETLAQAAANKELAASFAKTTDDAERLAAMYDILGISIEKGSITTLAGLQSALAKDSEKAAMNMKIFQEYLASGNYSAQELEAAMNKLGITMDQLPYDAFRKIFENTIKTGMSSTNNLKKLQAELNKLVKDGIKLTEVQQKMLDQVNQQLGTETFNVAQTLEDRFKGMIGSISNSLTDVVMGMKSGFEALEDIATSVLRTIISTLIEAQIRKMFFQESVSGMGGGGFSFASLANMGGGLGALGLGLGIGSLFAGFLADGGPASAGKPYVVGERGPELFVPNTSGTVVANEDLSMTGGEVLTVNFNINAIDTQTGTQFIVENENTITGLIQRAYNRRGQSGPLG